MQFDETLHLEPLVAYEHELAERMLDELARGEHDLESLRAYVVVHELELAPVLPELLAGLARDRAGRSRGA